MGGTEGYAEPPARAYLHLPAEPEGQTLKLAPTLRAATDNRLCPPVLPAAPPRVQAATTSTEKASGLTLTNNCSIMKPTRRSRPAANMQDQLRVATLLLAEPML
jgi:hypothetical protein